MALVITSPAYLRGRYVVPSSTWGRSLPSCGTATTTARKEVEILTMPDGDTMGCKYNMDQAVPGALLRGGGEDGGSEEEEEEEGPIVIATRGVCTLVRKSLSAFHAGASGVVIVNSEGYGVMGDMPSGGVDTSGVRGPVVSIGREPVGGKVVESIETWGREGKGGDDEDREGRVVRGYITCIDEEGGDGDGVGDGVGNSDGDTLGTFDPSVYRMIPNDPEGAKGFIHGWNTKTPYPFTWSNFGYFPSEYPYPFTPLPPSASVKYAGYNPVTTVVPALPPFGCEEGKYTSKVSGGVAAVMRGGGVVSAIR